MTVKELKKEIVRTGKKERSSEDQAKVAGFLWENKYTPNSDGIKKSKLKEDLENADIEINHTLETCLKNLRERDYVRRWIEGPQIFIIHDSKGIVNGEPLEQLVLDEQESLIQAIQDQDPDTADSRSETIADGGTPPSLRDIAASTLDVEPKLVEEALREGDVVPDQMEKHSEVVKAIEESNCDKNGSYHSIEFRHNPYRYSLTTNAVAICKKPDSNQ